MNSKQIVKAIMSSRGLTIAMLAEKTGYRGMSGIAERLRGKHEMRVDTLLQMLNAMDCELVVRSRLKDKTEYIVALDSREADESK